MARFDLTGFTNYAHTLIIEPDGFYRDGYPFPRERWAYRLYCEDTLIFSGNELGTPVGTSESEAAWHLMGFLTTHPNGSDAEYLETYTPAQRAWCDENADYLAMCLYGEEGEEITDLSAYQAEM